MTYPYEEGFDAYYSGDTPSPKLTEPQRKEWWRGWSDADRREEYRLEMAMEAEAETEYREYAEHEQED